ncbi:succinate dehydrogenase cytochrome b subunit [Microlunatus sp. Gsoil 973]|uniref:succinate dehydrogenase cytochrome b subunit n=1 Tax=Microlunatus sp. Gsoil 973 TaxID=2672569 RepID=UPI001E4FB5C4|nr:succinate dehydrogenase cytochrome b subunit [Microlunatus sp. Gsoil 973]
MALKALMAVSGLIMVLYLLAHMYGNLMAFGGRETFNNYATHLHVLGEPILPYDGFFWILRVVLTAALIAHIYAAAHLTARDWRARTGVTNRYQSKKGRRGVQRSYSSFTLRWGGVVIFLYVIFHILNLTTGTIHPGGPSPSPYDRLLNTMSVWWVVAVYTIALLAVGFHLRHGVWSALTTLGAHTSAKARTRLNILAYVISIAVTVGFLLVPWSIVAGLIH